MNIFDIVSGFFGEYKKGEMRQATDNFWEAAREIRSELGENSALLDTYLSEIFSGIRQLHISNIVMQSDYMSGEIAKICLGIFGIDGVKDCTEHKFHKTALEYIKSHPINCENKSIKAYIYMIGLIDEFSEFYFEKFINKYALKNAFRFNKKAIEESLKSICDILGEEKVKRLNEAIKQKFITPSLIGAVRRSAQNVVCYYLLMKDKESSKKIFQIILENKNV